MKTLVFTRTYLCVGLTVCSLICVAQMEFESNGVFLGEREESPMYTRKKRLCVSLRKSDLNTVWDRVQARFVKDEHSLFLF